MNEVGNNILSLMKERKYTQTKLAKEAKVSQATISAIINGAEPKEETLNSIARVFNVGAERLRDASNAVPVKLECPRCGSSAVVEFINHSNNVYRFHCGFCELDSGEQKSRGRAYNIFASFGASASAPVIGCRVLTLSELLDSRCFSNDVRPVWFENRGLFCVPALLQSGIAERENACVRVMWADSYGIKSYDIAQYNSWWRCWNDKPSATICEETPWQK